MRLGAALVSLARVGTRLPWFLNGTKKPVEKQFGPSTLHGKSERAAYPLRGNALAFVLGDFEEGEVSGAGVAGDKDGEVADLRRDLTERADDKAGHAPRDTSAHLCLGGSGCVRGRAGFRVEFFCGLVVVLVNLSSALLDGLTECRGWRL